MRISIRSFCFIPKSVEGAADPGRATVKDVGVVAKDWQERRASRRRSISLDFGMAPASWPGYRRTGFEGTGMELASGMGFPPPWGANEDYHFFFKNSTCGRFANRPYTNQIQPGPGTRGIFIIISWVERESSPARRFLARAVERLLSGMI